MGVKISEFYPLIGKIRAELARLECLVAAIALPNAQDGERPSPGQIVMLVGKFYALCEVIFQFIAAEVNGGRIVGWNWHNCLLDHIAREKSGRRPAVISPGTYRELGELLKFRHVLHSIPGYDLSPERVDQITRTTVELFPRLSQELEGFNSFLLNHHNQDGPAIAWE